MKSYLLWLDFVVAILLFSDIAANTGGIVSQFHKVYINPGVGQNNYTCLTANDESFPCKTLDFAFGHKNDSTAYILQVSNEELHLSESVTFANMSNLAFIGNHNVSIQCHEEGVGLAFINITEINFTQVTFQYCAAERNSTSRNFTTGGTLYTFLVGLYFYLGQNIRMSRVEVRDSPNAVGVVMYNVRGTNVIEESTFSNNSVHGSYVGGGGFYIEFTFCQPGDSNCTENSEVVPFKNSNYTFMNSKFENNTASNGRGFDSIYITPYKSNHQSFGRGGGLCLYLKGKAKYNTLNINNCTFKNNVAQWGSGVMLEFHDDAAGNKVYFSNCTFKRNYCNFTFDIGTGGGGMRLGHYVFNLNNSLPKQRNVIELEYCNFTSNHAMYGGGISISPASEVYIWIGKIKIRNTRFISNMAKFGSGVHISRYSFSTKGSMLSILMENVTLWNNSVDYFNLLNHQNSSYTIGAGAMYIVGVDVQFAGYFNISYNTGTGLAAAGSSLDFRDSRVTFEGNVGYMGGAVALLGTSRIIIDNFTTMTFSCNRAKALGGAMFVRYVEMDHLQTFFNCFIQHSQPFLTPDDWEANFTFINNADFNGRRPNSIHSTTTLPCSWAGGVMYTYDRNKTFCWQNWNYFRNDSKTNCSNEVTSEPGHIDPHNKDGLTYTVAIPGREFKLPILVSDDYGKDLTETTLFSSTVSNDKVEGSEYFWGGKATLQGNASNVSLSLESVGDLIWKTEVDVHLQPCPLGLQGNDCSCPRVELLYGGILTCDPQSHLVRMRNEHWIGQFKAGQYAAGLCPPGFCNNTENYFIDLPKDNNASKLEAKVCEDNRIGTLCGGCLKEYGPAVNSLSFDCVVCNSTNIASNIAKYASAIYVPLMAMTVILILFDIRLTTGPANGFILFSQMVTTTFALGAYGQIPFNKITNNTYSILQKMYSVPYGIFNLELGENLLSSFCISSKHTALTVLALDYVVASFPMLMIAFIMVCLKLKDFCFSKCFRKVRFCLRVDITPALLPAFASFLLLSFHKFSLTAFYLMSTQTLINESSEVVSVRVYYDGQRESTESNYVFLYLLPSVFVTLALFIVSVLLLSYPVLLLEKCLSKIKIFWKIYPVDKIHLFMDTFCGCYKVKMRFFAGLYFFFRLTINMAYILSDEWIVQFVVQQIACTVMGILVAIFQPYSEKFLNYVDAMMFTNLAILNTLSLYLFFNPETSYNSMALVFAIQYILTFFPLIYMIGYVAIYICKKKFLKVIRSNFKLKAVTLHSPTRNGSSNVSATGSKLLWLTQSADEELFARERKSIQRNQTWNIAKSSTSSNQSSNKGSTQSSDRTAYGTMSTAASSSTTAIQ